MSKYLIAGTLAVALAGCGTVTPPPPPRIVQAPPVVVIDNPLTVAARREALATFGDKRLKPGEFAWVSAAAMPKSGVTSVLISMRQQMGYVFRGGKLVAITTVSTGTKDHPTDPGAWPITAKKKFHRSNKYSNAPMPHMQRLDKWGRALHGGVVPGYPASHGCIRLPPLLAKRLFDLTKVGDVVNIET
ncbi:MAG: L,D-transpeptidase family protein [Pseudomonadota bacterium]|nr:L,D-transpeptidase family protein [Pseudomonadota bacterium]